ncbi:MAG TPA: MBL fold metallo-hydrolase [Puia sp.]|nr:MBL fold metallo-hydrolase [Puia sp.]
MDERIVFLKPNVVIEPLVDRWYAWSHLISPATAAMNILGRHMTIMQSYLSDPGIHAEAVLNPKMRGGPFMDLGGGQVEAVKALYDNTVEKRATLIQFAQAVKELDRILLTEAKGYSLEQMYKRVPEILRGFVELYYDRNNCATFRLFESLLYRSQFYRKDSQSIALWVTTNDHRPFSLSTPRLDAADVLHLPMPFDHAGIDELSKMKRNAQPLGYIKEVMGITPEQERLFETFFTEDPPPKYKKYTGDRIRMRYFGHACILVETKDVSILMDPLISYYGYYSDLEHFSDADLPDVIDYAMITHNHQDHILFETLLPLRHKIRNLVVPRTYGGRLEDPDLAMMFRNIGFKNVFSIEEMETVHFGDVDITGLPFVGEHADLNILTKSCYLVQSGDFKLLFLADSRIVDADVYKHIHRQIGNVDVLFLGMECDGAPMSWLYGPLMSKKLMRDQDNSRRLAGSDFAMGMNVVDIFHPKEAYVYAMGQEPWIEFITSIKYTDQSNPIVQSNMLVKRCGELGIISERLYGEKEILYDKHVVAVE